MSQTRKVIAVHLEGGENHEHITNVIWVDPQVNETDRTQSTREQMVTFVKNNPGQAYVFTNEKVLIGVVNATPPYIRTYRDNEWQDNLLSLKSY